MKYIMATEREVNEVEASKAKQISFLKRITLAASVRVRICLGNAAYILVMSNLNLLAGIKGQANGRAIFEYCICAGEARVIRHWHGGRGGINDSSIV